MDFILNREAEVTLAAHAILTTLKTLPDGVFAIDLWKQTCMSRDFFDDAIQLLIRNKDVAIKEHKLIVSPDYVPPFDPPLNLSWVEMKERTR